MRILLVVALVGAVSGCETDSTAVFPTSHRPRQAAALSIGPLTVPGNPSDKALVFGFDGEEEDEVREALEVVDWELAQSTQTRAEELAKRIHEVARKRYASLAPVLARNILFSPTLGITRDGWIHQSHPALYALVRIGKPAVPALIREMKGTRTYDHVDDWHKMNALVGCLDMIYMEGGQAREAARGYIKGVAAGPCADYERANLNWALTLDGVRDTLPKED